ncbi:endosomal/lysosomal proton channel TMEM175 isoform X2 [Bos taurus]|uniref:endosomal/lysosomal proton channel TMEM175 isoform X2 n=1 Tax=Bos taurus TaxID=9913 RepID=UPI0028CB31EF|nr:endosomal/lysosomal proton channel TMEM175 isoform X2 [Bos taurus]
MSGPQAPEPTLEGQADASAGSPDEDAAEGIQHSHRMLSFSDALLSIIATVMEFDKSVQRLLATRIAVYLMTFLIVTVAWAAHTRLFQVVGKIDDTLALLNLACMMTITFLPFTVSHRGFRPHFHPGPSRPPLTPEHALLKLSDSWAVGLDHVVAEVSGSRPVPVTGRGLGWGWGDACPAPGAPGLLAELGSSLQVTHHLLTQQLLDSEGGPCSERSASQRVGVWGAFMSLKTFSFKGFKLRPKGSCSRDAPFPDGSAVAQAWPSGLAGALIWVFLAAVFLDGDLPRGASGHLPVLHVCDRHWGRAGADRALRLPLPAPPKPPDRALCPPRPLPAARPGHHRAGPRALPGRRRLLPLLLPRGCCPGPTFWSPQLPRSPRPSSRRAHRPPPQSRMLSWGHLLVPTAPQEPSAILQSYLLMAMVIVLPHVSKAAGWCRAQLVGLREPPAHSVEVFTFDLHEPLSKERVEAFSDGVYAIVATLLILDICEDNVPDAKDVKEKFQGSLVAALGESGPHFLAYFGSFATVGLLWFAHHSLFLHIRRATQPMGLLNTLSLAFVGGLPLAYQQTSAFTKQPRDELESVRISCAIIFLASIFQFAIWTTALLQEGETLQPSARFGGREHAFMFAKLALYPCASLLAFACTCVLSSFSTAIFHAMQIAVPFAFLLLRLLVRLALAGLRALRGLVGPVLARPAPGAADEAQSPLLPAPC